MVVTSDTVSTPVAYGILFAAVRMPASAVSVASSSCADTFARNVAAAAVYSDPLLAASTSPDPAPVAPRLPARANETPNVSPLVNVPLLETYASVSLR